MRLAGISAVAHIVGLVVVSILPRLMSSPPPRVSMVAEIVPASALLPPAGTPAPPRQTGPTPSQRAADARQAQEKKPPVEKPPQKAPPKPPKKDPTVPPLDSAKPPKKKEPEKQQPAAEETQTQEEKLPEAQNGTDPNHRDEPEGPAPGAGLSLGSTAGFDASGVPTLGSSAFPYDYYRSTLMTLLQSNWRRPVVTDGLGEPLRCGIGFTILKSGIVKDAHIAEPSGNPGLDRSALRAVVDSNPLPPLPFQYGHDAVSAVVFFKLTED